MKKLYLLLCACSLGIAAGETIIPPDLQMKVDLRNYHEIEKKDNTIKFDQNNSQTNGIYNYRYSPLEQRKKQSANIFLDRNFDKIERFSPLYFKGDTLDNDSNKTLNDIIEKIKEYRNSKNQGVAVTIIGYTQKTENNATKVNLESAYANFFQSVAQRNNMNPKKAREESIDYMKNIYDTLVDHNISKKILYRENRAGKDALKTEEFSDGREKNNRVEVAIYAKSFIDPDTDKDGVHDSKDYCPNTPLGSSVDKNGCPQLMNLDLKFDFDKATISDKKSLDAIEKLVKFMKKYPSYHAHIVGNTDSAGSAKYNLKLSLRRAKFVVKIMEDAGIDPSRLSFEGKGESEPLFENINPFNRHMNRRTEVELTLPEEQIKQKKIEHRVGRRKG
ncbi:OmpA family protein [Sulfurimonas sp.]|uniref:OmpA family protein n=1 Tax=Sulfurimonas sp. TaxID=2022749 RepID=UPI002636D477|nr:OmpA family protein [Sulfurimonas sp.]